MPVLICGRLNFLFPRIFEYLEDAVTKLCQGKTLARWVSNLERGLAA